MNVLTRFTAMAPHIMGRHLYEVFPGEFKQNLPFDRVRVGCCIWCGNNMPHSEMFPRDRQTPRALCSSCWNQLTAGITTDCWVCEYRLEDSRIQAQMRNPHDLHHRVHDGECIDYFSLVSAKALGQNTGIIETIIPQNQQALPSGNVILGLPQPVQQDIIDVTPQNVRRPLPINR